MTETVEGAHEGKKPSRRYISEAITHCPEAHDVCHGKACDIELYIFALARLAQFILETSRLDCEQSLISQVQGDLRMAREDITSHEEQGRKPKKKR